MKDSSWLVLGLLALAVVGIFVLTRRSAGAQYTYSPQVSQYSNVATYDISFSEDFSHMKVVVHRDAKVA